MSSPHIRMADMLPGRHHETTTDGKPILWSKLRSRLRAELKLDETDIPDYLKEIEPSA